MNTTKISLSGLIIKSVVLHPVTYFLAGLVAANLFNYAGLFAIPSLAGFMRPYDSVWVLLGPLFQPVRGVLFALALYPLRESLFKRKFGWLVIWWLLVAIGILSTYGPTPGSIEGMVYTVITVPHHLRGLPEVLVQSAALAFGVVYLVNHPEKRWLHRLVLAAFVVLMVLPVLGLLVGPR